MRQRLKRIRGKLGSEPQQFLCGLLQSLSSRQLFKGADRAVSHKVDPSLIPCRVSATELRRDIVAEGTGPGVGQAVVLDQPVVAYVYVRLPCGVREVRAFAFKVDLSIQASAVVFEKAVPAMRAGRGRVSHLRGVVKDEHPLGLDGVGELLYEMEHFGAKAHSSPSIYKSPCVGAAVFGVLQRGKPLPNTPVDRHSQIKPPAGYVSLKGGIIKEIRGQSCNYRKFATKFLACIRVRFDTRGVVARDVVRVFG
mmetsp:Transcript_32977/g.53503  ORF Transcript_32977/g.53503 Transcript_32977/m.53503 type:complete len:252 (-) Transcript_32977:228-983(-)